MHIDTYRQKVKDIRSVFRVYMDLAESEDVDFAQEVRRTLGTLIIDRARPLAANLAEFANAAADMGADSYHVGAVYQALGMYAYRTVADGSMDDVEPLLGLEYHIGKINADVDAKAEQARLAALPQDAPPEAMPQES